MSDGFEELGPRSMLPNPRLLKYAVDGEVPDVLYTLNHVSQTRRFLGRKMRSSPHTNEPTADRLTGRPTKLQAI